MKYKEAYKRLCEAYAKDPMVRFIGYNTAYGSRMYGTLSDVAMDQCIEAPVAENLMVGLGLGMSLEGFKPVICFERHDFLLLALDALVNHMDKLPGMSGGQFKYPIIVRAIVGGKEPLNAGPQHTQNYYQELKGMMKNTPVYDTSMMRYEGIRTMWNRVGSTPSGAVVLVEYKDLYDKEML